MALAYFTTNLLHELVEFVRFNIRFSYSIVSASLRSMIPIGVLKRKNIKDKLVLITGTASGIGRLMAIKFGECGAHIILWDIDEKNNKETQRILTQLQIKSSLYTVNLADKSSIYEAAEKVKEELGDVYMVINNAGIVIGKHLCDLTDKDIELTMNVNVNSLFYVTKSFLPKMIEKDSGHIVTIASIAGHAGIIGLSDYCASKHAAVGFMASLYRELYHSNSKVQTTCVSPYYINTGMFDGVTESRLSPVCPILEPNYVVDRIAEAVLTNTPHLILPKFLYYIKFMGSFLPQTAVDAIYDYTGTDDTMIGFHGRNKKPEAA